MPFKTRNFYKIVGPDGKDLWKGTEDYVDAIGWTIYLTTPITRYGGQPRICTSDVLHASLRLTDALRHVKPHGINKWGRFRVLVVRGTPVVKDEAGRKYGFREFDVLHEITSPGALVEILLDENRGRPRFSGGRWVGVDQMQMVEAINIVHKWFVCAEPWRKKIKARLK